ncbi:MAG: hypothetical protein ACK559_31855, partial [bacterium]
MPGPGGGRVNPARQRARAGADLDDDLPVVQVPQAHEHLGEPRGAGRHGADAGGLAQQLAPQQQGGVEEGRVRRGRPGGRRCVGLSGHALLRRPGRVT